MAVELYEVVVKDPPLKDVFREFGRRITLGKVAGNAKAGNFDAKYIKVTFSVANVQHQIEHGLSRVPIGMIQVSDLSLTNVVGLRIETTKAPDSRFMYLKADEARPVFLLIW